MRILQDYFLSLPEAAYNNRRPAQELLVSSTAPHDRKNRDARVDVMRDVQPGAGTTWVVAHSGMGHDFVLDLAKAFEVGTELKVERLDPRTGERTNLGSIQAAAKSHFETPSKGGVEDDWVFIFTR